MQIKKMLPMADVRGELAPQSRNTGLPGHLDFFKNILKKVLLYFKGEKKDVRATPDPAAAVIAQISNSRIRQLVKELHYLTPASLKAIRKTCPDCFFLPEDCPYEDYSIPDVKKAVKRINAQAELSSDPSRVIGELGKVNRELAYHLNEHFSFSEDSEKQQPAGSQVPNPFGRQIGVIH
jgi:hypothetical protein